MRYKQMGRTGLYVSEICLGTMTFGGDVNDRTGNAIGTLGQAEAEALIEAAIQAGVNFIDTADVYSKGRAETLLGRALRSLNIDRSSLVIATKVHGQCGAGPNQRGSSRGHIMDSVAASLDRLQTDHVDLYQIHGNDAITPIEETLRALDDLTSRGMVRYIGVSNWMAWKIAKALGISERGRYVRFETLQAYYSIAGRDLERDIVPLIEEEKLGLMVWSPLAGGLLSGKFGPGAADGATGRRHDLDFPPVELDRAWACIAAMRDVAAAHGVSVAQIALGWLLAKPHVMSVIVGAKTVAQLQDNLAATALRLTDAQLAALDQVSALRVEYPQWMIENQGARRIPHAFRAGG
jgi:aryl-alcohol dehydrogenase-like predicted oxidoreductase